MEKCDYGCGNEAKYVFKNGKRCCSSKYRSCPHQAAKIGKLRLGQTHTEETKRKIGNKSRERIQTNGGSHFKGKFHSEETKHLISEKKKGGTPWNKGLTKETDNRVRSSATKNSDGRTANFGTKNGMYGKTHSKEVKEKQRTKNIKEGKWKGKNNPWYGKDRSGENSPRFLSEKERSEWEHYSQIVRSMTEQQYRKNKDKINPSNYKRGTHHYHLDHIIPLWYGFKNNIDPYKISKIKNLRMVWWKENLTRYKTKLSAEETLLLEQL